MFLTYATVDDFLQMKDLAKSGLITVSDTGKNKIDTYLERATRYIQRQTRRQFFPWIETRKFPVPHAFYDLAMRRFPGANLNVDQDLLEAQLVFNGQTIVPPTSYYLLEANIKPHFTVALKFPYYWGGLFGGSYPFNRYDTPIITVTGIWGYADYNYPYEFWIDTFTVAPVLDDSQTTFEVEDVQIIDNFGQQAFTVGRFIRIEDEFMLVVARNITTNILTVQRGIRGSTAVAHAVDKPITRWRVIEDITEVTLQIAKIWRESDIAAGGRIGVSDVSTGVEISIPADPLKILASYQRSMIFG